MQERCRADDFIEDHQRSGHQGAGFELERCGKGRRRLHLVDEDRAADAYGLGGDCTLLGKEAETDETVGQLALGLFSDKFVAGAAAPKINAADLEEFARGAEEERDQSGRVSTPRGL